MDIQIKKHGSIYLVTPKTEAGRDWINNNIPKDARYRGKSIVVESTHIGDIAKSMIADGVVVE